MHIVDGWLVEAEGIYYPLKSMSRNGSKPTHIVLHGTAGGTSAQAIANYFKNSDVAASAHVVIGTDGHVVQGISFDDAAWANGILDQPRLPWPASVNPNDYTISIEHCKPSNDNSDVLTDAQAHASFQVVQAICDAYGIAKRRSDVHSSIVEHADFDSVTRARCPGLYPWDTLMHYLKGETHVSGVPHNWTDDGTTLKAPNGHVVREGMRDYILKHSWDADNWPVEDEQKGLSPLEQSNPGLGVGNQQIFNTCVLEYTPTRGVFMAYVGPELLCLRKKIADLQAQLAAGKK